MKEFDQVERRVDQLRNARQARSREMETIRDICDGGEKGLAALVGAIKQVNANTIPVANLILSGLERLSEKLSRVPDLRIDAPDHTDSERPRKQAEKRERIVAAYNEADQLDMKLPQNGLWLPGYGFTVWVITERVSPDGHKYPAAELRDPWESYPGEHGASNQPADCAFVWRMPARDLADRYPQHKEKIFGKRMGGGILLDPNPYPSTGATTWSQHGGWASNSGAGVEIAEYYDADGVWVFLPDKHVLLEHYEHPLRSGPPFVVMRKFSFNKSTGQYDHVVGMQSAIAKMSFLALIAMEDNANAETNIYGPPPANGYNRGRFATNYLEGVSKVEKIQGSLPYQFFQEVDRIERHFRVVAGYPVTDDAQSPANMAATGQGLERLMAGIDGMVKRYLQIQERGLQMLDGKMLEWDDRAYANAAKPLVGFHRNAPFSESYTPGKHIARNYRTRRTYGAMAGLDDAQKIVAILQLLQARLIDPRTAREQLDGLQNITLVEDRVRANQVEETLFQAMVSGQPMDPRVAMTLIELLPASDTKDVLRKFWTPEDPQMSPEEEAMAAPAPPGAGEPIPDVATVMSQLTSGGGASGGVRTIGALPGRAA